MKLTSYTNYSLRILMVAAMRDGELVTIQEVAEAFGVSKAHLVKCVHQLGVWGYLDNVRGRHGGFRLAVPAHKITVGEVVRKTEDCLGLVECFDAESNTCPMIGLCLMGEAFKEACAAFLAVLDKLTIADATRNRDALLGVLHLANHPQARAGA
jgi:Rrf2 family nitric oxide-sensitive transcriptional repressor